MKSNLSVFHLIVKVTIGGISIDKCDTFNRIKQNCFEIVVLEKTRVVPWTARRSSQAILKEINSEYSLESLRLKLKCQYFGHLLQRANSLEKTPVLEKIEGRMRSRWQRMVGWHLQLTGQQFEKTLGDSWGQGSLAAVHGSCKQSGVT